MKTAAYWLLLFYREPGCHRDKEDWLRKWISS